MTRTEKDKAVKKVEIAIDKMVDLQDLGIGFDITNRAQRLLDDLNELRSYIEFKPEGA